MPTDLQLRPALSIPRSLILSVLLIGLSSGFSIPALAESFFVQERERTSNFIRNIDQWHEAISIRVSGAANNIDEFFGDERALEESNRTQLRLNSAIQYEDVTDLTIKLSFSGNISLPRVSERIQLFIDTEGRERDVKEGFQTAPGVDDDQKSLFTGLRYVTRETRRSLISLDGGLRWRGGPVPIVRLRGRRTFVYDEWAIRLVQTFFWVEDRGFGEQTRVDFERKLNPQHFLRITPSAIWSEWSQGVDVRQIVSVVHIRDDDNMIALELDVQGHTHSSAKVDKYEASLRWRTRGHRPWLFYEVAPGMAFKREFDYEIRPVLTLRVEATFGETQLRRRQ